MEFNLDPHEQKLVDLTREFAKDKVAPNAATWEAERKVPLDTIRAAAALSLAGLLVPRELGDQGLSYTAVARIMEELAAGCMYFAFILLVHNNLAIPGRYHRNSECGHQQSPF
jgi:alkylation response protein AidB-like acyl-CoA dehydrogenase